MNESGVRRKITSIDTRNTAIDVHYQQRALNGAPHALFGILLVESHTAVQNMRALKADKKNPNPALIALLDTQEKNYLATYTKTAEQFQHLCKKDPFLAHSLLVEELHCPPESTNPTLEDVCAYITTHLGEESINEIQRLVNTSVAQQKIQQSPVLREYSRDELIVHLAAQMLLDHIHTHGIPSEQLLLRIIQRHIAKTRLQIEEMYNELPHLMTQARAHITQAIEHNSVPISLDFFHQRMNSLLIVPTDPLAEQMQEFMGKYITDAHIILLPAGLSTEKKLHALLHEIYHALSGQLIYLKDNEEDISSRAIVKSGGRFIPNPEKKMPSPLLPRLQWIDEALVELSVMATTHISEPAYPQERALVQKCIDLGIPQSVFLNMVFEHAAHEEIQGVKVSSLPHTRALFHAIDARFYWGFLSDLDLIIRYDSADTQLQERPMNEGVQDVLNNWKEDTQAFIEWVKKHARIIKACYRSIEL